MSDRQISREHFDAVLKRASELAARDAHSVEHDLSETELLRIAREVGLSERHVRRALAEMDQGASPDSFVDRIMGPSLVVVGRVLPGSTELLADRIDEFLVGGRLLQRLRRTDRMLQFRPSVDWISQFARAASGTSRKYFVASARSVQVTFDRVEDDRTEVVFTVDPGIRSDHIAGAVAGGGFAGLGVGSGVGFSLLATLGPEVAIAGGVMAAAGVLWGATGIAARAHRRKHSDVEAEVEGVLDQLERGESPEPPPRAWLSWVERQFHGARRLLEPADSPRTSGHQ